MTRAARLLLITLAFTAAACGGDKKSDGNPSCTNGICGTSGKNGGGGGDGSSGTNGGSGNGSGGNGSGGNGSGGNGSGGNGSGGNGSGGNGSGGNGSGGSGGSGGPNCSPGANCQEAWTCTPWETATTPTGTLPTADNAGKRTCTDACNCGTTNNKPTESVTLPALDFAYYQCSVEPIFDKFCAQLGCHGTESGRALRVYARAKLRITGETWSFTNVCNKSGTRKSEECIGGDECECYALPHSKAEWQRNFDAARAFALDGSGNALGNIEDSELLKQPLKLSDGGLAHAGIHIFGKSSTQYTTIKNWLDGSGTGCSDTSQKTN